MAVKTIPDLPSKNTLANTDLLVVDDGEHTYKISWQAFQSLISAISAFDAQSDGSLKITLSGGASLSAKPSDPDKQDKLTFDSTPTQNSSNPVTSSGILTALNTKLNSADYKLFKGATSSAAGEAGIVPAPGSPDYYLGSAGSWETPDSTPTANSKKLITSGGVRSFLNNYIDIQANAGFHNSIYRGKNLGTSVTAAQWAAISSGAFTDMYIGDYWVINGITWRIAHFDYWYKCGDTQCTTHHVVIVPDTCLTSSIKMNSDNSTAGGYIGCGPKSGTNHDGTTNTGLSAAATIVNNAFGSAHILNHRMLFVNAVTNGYPSAGGWYDSTVDLMNEPMVYGSYIFTPGSTGTVTPYRYTESKTQLALFRLAPEWICIRAHWWLRDVVTAAYFAIVAATGDAHYTNASNAFGVRPAFAIRQS